MGKRVTAPGMRRKGRSRVAQIRGQETGEPVIITFQGDSLTRADLEKALEVERRSLPLGAGPRAMTLSKVVRHVVSLGLDVYWALEELRLDPSHLAPMVGAQSRREAIASALRAGLEQLRRRPQ